MKITKIRLEKLTNDLLLVAKMGVANRSRYVILLKDDDLLLVPNKGLKGLLPFVPEKQTELLIENLQLALTTRTLGKYREIFYKELESLLTTKMLVAEKRKKRAYREKERVVKMMNKYSRNKRGVNL